MIWSKREWSYHLRFDARFGRFCLFLFCCCDPPPKKFAMISLISGICKTHSSLEVHGWSCQLKLLGNISLPFASLPQITRLVLHVHVGLHLLHLPLGLGVIHHLWQHRDEQQRQHHHQNHRVHQHVGDLPLLALVEVRVPAHRLHLQGVRNLGDLGQMS